MQFFFSGQVLTTVCREIYPVADFLEILFEICGVVEKGRNSKKFAPYPMGALFGSVG